MKRNDWILVIGILCATILFSMGRFFVGRQEAGSVVVKVNGVVKATYTLSEDTEVEIDNKNVFTISDGQVKMVSATCPDQHCVHQKAISKNRESIICLPNKVVIEIQSKQQSAFDAIAK